MPDSVTRPTFPRSISFDVGIHQIERVPVLAVGFWRARAGRTRHCFSLSRREDPTGEASTDPSALLIREWRLWPLDREHQRPVCRPTLCHSKARRVPHGIGPHSTPVGLSHGRNGFLNKRPLTFSRETLRQAPFGRDRWHSPFCGSPALGTTHARQGVCRKHATS